MGREEQQGRKADVRSGEVSLPCARVHLKPFHARCALRKTSLREELQAQSVAYVNNGPDAVAEMRAFISQHH